MKVNRTVEKTVRILELLSNNKNGMTCLEISVMLDLPKTSTYDILETLVLYNFLTTTFKKQKIYLIGIKSFEISKGYSESDKLMKLAAPILRQLADSTKRIVFFAVESEETLVYVNRYQSDNSFFGPTCKLGTRKPLHCTALGKAVLSQYYDEELEEKLNSIEFVRHTENTIMNINDLKISIEEVRKVGFSIDDEEDFDGIRSYAAVILNDESNVVGAISVSGIKINEDVNEIGMLVKKAADELSYKLGYVFN